MWAGQRRPETRLGATAAAFHGLCATRNPLQPIFVCREWLNRPPTSITRWASCHLPIVGKRPSGARLPEVRCGRLDSSQTARIAAAVFVVQVEPIGLRGSAERLVADVAVDGRRRALWAKEPLG